jgi:hypothetical protein
MILSPANSGGGLQDFLPALDDKRGLVVDAILFTNLL